MLADFLYVTSLFNCVKLFWFHFFPFFYVLANQKCKFFKRIERFRLKKKNETECWKKKKKKKSKKKSQVFPLLWNIFKKGCWRQFILYRFYFHFCFFLFLFIYVVFISLFFVIISNNYLYFRSTAKFFCFCFFYREVVWVIMGSFLLLIVGWDWDKLFIWAFRILYYICNSRICKTDTDDCRITNLLGEGRGSSDADTNHWK